MASCKSLPTVVYEKKITVVKEEDWNTLPEYQVRDSLTTATGRGIGVPESVCR